MIYIVGDDVIGASRDENRACSFMDRQLGENERFLRQVF
jgi:hypothetical protein